MFRTKKMKRVRIILLKSQVGDLIRELHEVGLVDIRKTKYEGLDEGRPLAFFDEVSTELFKLRPALTMMEMALDKKSDGEANIIDGKIALAESRALNVGETLKSLNNEATEVFDKIKTLESDIDLIDKLSNFNKVDFTNLSTRTMNYKIGELSPVKISSLKDSVEKNGGNVITEPGYKVVLILFPRKNQQKIEELITEVGLTETEVPNGMTSPETTMVAIKNQIRELRSKLNEKKKMMADLSRVDIQKVRSLVASLEIEAERSEIASRFSESKKIYVLEGWIFAEKLDELKTLLQKHPDVVLDEVHIDAHHDMPPTVLDNPGIVGPMEFITKSYSLPNYFELDPSISYLIFLPIMYGMIVGDVLYGLMSLIIAYFLYKKFQKSYIMSNVSKIWMYSAIPTMIFGLFYDEWAGMSHYKLAQFIGSWLGVTLLKAPLYTGFGRIENVLALVALSVAVGMIHLAFGFVFGAINEWNHNKKHSIGKIAWIGVEVGILLALLPYLPSMFPQLGNVDPAFTPAGLVVLILSVIMLGATEGIVGIIEIPGLIGNALSYSRIAAIGIVGVVIAQLLNQTLIPLPQGGLLAILLIPIFIIFHLLNCFIAMFESIVQGGRLNIVEFRSKFLQGGADVFIPFSLYSKKL